MGLNMSFCGSVTNAKKYVKLRKFISPRVKTSIQYAKMFKELVIGS